MNAVLNDNTTIMCKVNCSSQGFLAIILQICVCVCVCVLRAAVSSHHSCSLHGVANNHDDAAFVVVEDSRRGALQELAGGAERCAERNADATSNMASAEAGTSGVKEDGTAPGSSGKGQNSSGTRIRDTSWQCQT